MFKHFILCSKAIFITVILLMVTGCSDNNETETKVENALRGPVVLADSPQAMNLEQRMQRYKVPNVSIAVVSGSAIDFAKAYGANVDQNTLFQAGSISKTLNAFGILTLVSQGKVNLDKDVNQYLKRWKIKHNKYYKETDKITLRQILSHSAGFNAPEIRVYEIGKKLPSTPEILNGEPGVANAKPVEVICNPGEKFQYSNYGIVVSQLVLEDVTGEDYADWMQKNVLEPLGMNNSTFKQPLPLVLQSKAIAGHDADGKVIAGKYSAFPSATGGLWSTPTDLAKFVLAMFKISDGSQDYSISKKLQDEMFAKQINDEEFSSNYYGLGVSLAGDNNNFYFSHNGRTEGFISGMVAKESIQN